MEHRLANNRNHTLAYYPEEDSQLKPFCHSLEFHIGVDCSRSCSLESYGIGLDNVIQKVFIIFVYIPRSFGRVTCMSNQIKFAEINICNRDLATCTENSHRWQTAKARKTELLKSLPGSIRRGLERGKKV